MGGLASAEGGGRWLGGGVGASSGAKSHKPGRSAGAEGGGIVNLSEAVCTHLFFGGLGLENDKHHGCMHVPCVALGFMSKAKVGDAAA